MKKIVKELLAIEQDQKIVQNKYGGAQKRNHWSDVFSRRNGVYRLLVDIVKKSVKKKLRPKIKNIVQDLLKESKLLHLELSDALKVTPADDAGEAEWRDYEAEVRGQIRRSQQTLHLRRRVRWKMNMKKWKREREEQRKRQHEVRRYYNYALMRPTNDDKPTVLHVKDERGEMVILDKKPDIYNKEVEVTRAHMGLGRERWYKNGEETFPLFEDSEEGKQLRRQVQNGTLPETEWQKIPPEVRGVIRCARASTSKLTGTAMNASMYGNIFTADITLQELDRYLARVRKNTAPGISGIRVDHIAGLPDEMRLAIAKVLSVPYTSGLKYTAWQEQIVNWIPKELGNPDINKRRPLMYYEVLHKMRIGIRLHRVSKVWLKHGLIDENNYAFLAGKSTMQPLMIKKIILEETRELNKPLTLVDVDFSKAYDSTEKFAKELTLRRMGFSEEGIDMWMCFDSTRNMRVLTAFGLTDGFTPECGAWGQGAVEAPIGWLAFMSWMSAYVETKATSPYIYGRGKHKLSLNKVIYADDGTYLASSRQGAQRVLNAVAEFATATGIMIKPAKSYTYSNRPGEPLTVTTYEKSNTKYKLRNKVVTVLAELDETHYFRHLGNVQNAQGHTPTEPTVMYDGSTQDNILTKVRKSMAALAARNITVGGVMQVLQAVVVRQILYPTTFGNMGDKELNVIQNQMEAVIKKKLRYPRHMKNAVLYGHEQAGGVGLDHIQTLVNVNRLILLMNCLSQGGEMKKIMIGAVQRLQEYACTERCPLEVNVTGYT